MSFRIFLLSLCLISPALRAEDAPAAAPAAPAADAPAAADNKPLTPEDLLKVGIPRSQAERDDMEARGLQLQEAAKTRRTNAETGLEDAKTACWKKFLVSSCLEDARTAYHKEISQAKHDDHQAQTLQRNVHKFDAAAHAKQRDEENARRDAENERKAAEYRVKREAELKKLRANGVVPEAQPPQ